MLPIVMIRSNHQDHLCKNTHYCSEGFSPGSYRRRFQYQHTCHNAETLSGPTMETLRWQTAFQIIES